MAALHDRWFLFIALCGAGAFFIAWLVARSDEPQ